jgi:hypothetical protein
MPESETPSKRFATFTPAEIRTMAEHGIAVYRDKLIIEARPPITEAEAATIARRIGTSVPEGLLELWGVAYGGSLDYELTVPLGEHMYTASVTELFWPGSDGSYATPAEHREQAARLEALARRL